VAAPRGRSYTPSRGPLAGQTFNAPANARGETAAYNAYQNALARHYGQPSYSALKTQRENPLYQNVLQRGLNNNRGRAESHRLARAIVGNTRIPQNQARGTYRGSPGNPNPTGKRMADIIGAIYREGLYDDNEDVEDIFY
jgi:hypothetical protein